MHEHDIAIADKLKGATVALDCRWLRMGGAGRITEHLLGELRASPPPGAWILWGREEAVRPLVFPNAAVHPSRGDPRSLFGQRDAFRAPRSDVTVYLHQIRPLRPGRAVTFILDTIPLRYGGSRPVRLAKRAFFLLSARLSMRVITISDFSRGSIARDLGVPFERIATVRLPADKERIARVVRLRETLPPDDVLLYVGRFDAHKNLHRLCAAFARSQFAREGRLLLVGGWADEVEAMREWVESEAFEHVTVRPACDEAELDRLLATSRALIVPSLEEGYGLPAFEAAAAGLPVAASRTGAMTELPSDVAALFDPRSEDEIATAIDNVTARSPGRSFEAPDPTLRDVVLSAVAAALAA